MKFYQGMMMLAMPLLVLASSPAQADLKSSRTGYEAYMQALKEIPSGYSQHQLKVYLMDSYFDVYAIYRELSEAKQKQVYDFYTSSDATNIDDLDAVIREML